KSGTWIAYQTLFTDHLEAVNKAPNTIRTYNIAVSQLGDFLGHPDPLKLKATDVVAFMRAVTRPKADGGLGLGDASALQRYRSIQQYFRWLHESGERRDNPMGKMKPPALPEKLVPVVSEGDIRKLLKACAGNAFDARRDRAIISLFIDTGMRLSEMACIKVADLDLVERSVVVMGKGRRRRVLAFVRETRTDIQRYVLARQRRRYASIDALWLGHKGTLTAPGIYQMLQRRCEEAGIPAIHPHQLRHTFAHMYLKAGGNEGDLMRVTGWKSRSMVDRYGASAASARALEAHERFSPRNYLG
ncbi:MAG: tyrosine-type recombinase/integrase, partial [Phycisphaerae bacterium]